MNAMKFNGLERPEDVSERLWDIPGSHGICNNLCYGYMTYNKTDGVYLIPATETVEGVRAKIKEFEETGVDPFARDYEKAPPVDLSVWY